MESYCSGTFIKFSGLTIMNIKKTLYNIFFHCFFLVILLGISTNISATSLTQSHHTESLIVSNYPENINGPGPIFHETIKDTALRIMYYHKNSSKIPLFVNITLQNNSDSNEIVRLIKATGGSVKDGIFAGHQSTKRYLNELLENKYELITLKPHEKKTILFHKIKPALVATGLIRIESSHKQSLHVNMSIIDKKYPSLSLLNAVNHGQGFSYGYFLNATKEITLDFDCDKTLKEIPVGKEPYFVGNKRGLVLHGNYAILYHVNLRLINSQSHYKKVKGIFYQ